MLDWHVSQAANHPVPEVTYNFVVAIQQEWAKKYIKDHDGVIKAEDVTKYMLLKFRKALNIHGKV